jgi:hypothetical protein
MKKRKQHYVSKHYLRAWSSDEQIFCLRNGKIFISNLIGVANERDFYNLRELNEADIEFVKTFAIEPSTPFLKKVHLRTLELFTSVFWVKHRLEKTGKNSPDINQEIEELINNFEEDFHAQVEGDAVKYINLILNENLSFYKDREERVKFLCFLCFQLFRTKKIKYNMISKVYSSGFSEELCISFEKTYNIFSHVFAFNLAYSLAINSKFKILLILNNTSVPFLTGDQPVTNTFASGKSLKNMPNELNVELYYPVSPNIAILITERKEYIDIDNLYITELDIIQKYNSIIIEESHEQIYSNSEELLKSCL